ncbi:MAG: putative universal stress protein [Syntrophus sp. PtaU1.Bin005]|jgi:nucleotide-binding universal stress UspA family protein|nr:MAG: putative universal stress protein [Syntrophus sp. PtaB.Bin138]OPY81816.1 MAG: putative universal stress protein [Syntrophus sp. PtaU1.Bin005]
MFQKILYPTDFSDTSKKALEYLLRLREAGAREVVIVHVVDTRSLHIPEVYSLLDLSRLGEKQEISAREEADRIAARLNERGIGSRVRIEKGIPFREILRAEAEEDVSMIVIGSHGMSNVKEMLMGSVSEQVIRKARKPVLVVKR